MGSHGSVVAESFRRSKRAGEWARGDLECSCREGLLTAAGRAKGRRVGRGVRNIQG